MPPDVIPILRLKCTKFDFGRGSAPDPAGELTALPQTTGILGVLLLKEGERKTGEVKEGKGEKKDKREAEGRCEGDIPPHPLAEA